MPVNIPDWSYEARYEGLVCGVDEAGRGPLAGPVVAAAVILDPQNLPEGLNDSKALSKKAREQLLNKIIVSSKVGVGVAEPEEIDRLNILGATMAAMVRAVQALPVCPVAALIDGNKVPPLKICSEAIVKGDAKSLSIAAASIVAKVTRDRLMVLAAKRYAIFGFDGHKGYPTQYHRSQLKENGASPIHRREYAPVKAAIIASQDNCG